MMACESDRATEIEEAARDAALKRARGRAAMRPLGCCYWCEKEARGLFCDVDCRNMWQRERDAMARAGRV